MIDTVSYRYFGDETKARMMKGFGDLQLSILKNQMSLGDLDQYKRTVLLPDGSSVLCTRSFGIAVVNIYAPVIPTLSIEEEEKKEEKKKTYFRIKIFRDDDLNNPIGDQLDIPREDRIIEYFRILEKRSIEPELTEVCRINIYEDSNNCYYKCDKNGIITDSLGIKSRIYNELSGYWEFDSDYIYNHDYNGENGTENKPTKTPYIENDVLSVAEYFDGSIYTKGDTNGYFIEVALKNSTGFNYYLKNKSSIYESRTEGKYTSPPALYNDVWYRNDCLMKPSTIEFSVPYWNTVYSNTPTSYESISISTDCATKYGILSTHDNVYDSAHPNYYSNYDSSNKQVNVKSSIPYKVTEKLQYKYSFDYGYSTFNYNATGEYADDGLCSATPLCTQGTLNVTTIGSVINTTFLSTTPSVNETAVINGTISISGVDYTIESFYYPIPFTYTATCESPPFPSKTCTPECVSVMARQQHYSYMNLTVAWDEY